MQYICRYGKIITTNGNVSDTVTINFDSPIYTIPENGGSVTVCLTTNGANDEPLPVLVSAAPATATGTENRNLFHIQISINH